MSATLLQGAIAAIKLGRPVRIDGLGFVAVETASAELLSLLDPRGTAPLLLSGRRAAALSLANARDAADPARPVLIERSDWLDAGTALALADPGQDLVRAPVGPLHPLPLAQPELAGAALKLARMAGLLPALWLLGEADGVALTAAEVAGEPEVTLVARARLPIDQIPDAQMLAFRAADGSEHAALVMGAFGGRPPLVRLHSECLTGDVFGSGRCDCGDQLDAAMRTIAEAGSGVDANSIGEVDLAMIPIENSIAGRVADIHHLLPTSGLQIVGEHFLRRRIADITPLGGARLDELAVDHAGVAGSQVVGKPETMLDHGDIVLGSWGGGPGGPIWRVPAAGGTATARPSFFACFQLSPLRTPITTS